LTGKHKGVASAMLMQGGAAAGAARGKVELGRSGCEGSEGKGESWDGAAVKAVRGKVRVGAGRL